MSSFFKRALAAMLLVSCTVAFAAKPPEKTAEAVRNPIQVPGAAWAFDGFVLNIPSDSGWYSTAKDPRYADLTKDFGNGLKAALVVEARRLEEGSIVKESELLALIREDQTALPDAAMKLLDYTAEPFSPKGVLCTRFTVKFDDRRKTFDAPGILLVRGVACVPPSDPHVIVSVRYAQRATDGEWAEGVRASAEPVLESLRFMSSNETAIQQARDVVRGEHPEQAIEILSPAAQEGDVEAALFLGNVYLYAHGMQPDYALARRWLEVAARAGRVDALYNLGAMYDKGIGMERDVQQALHWFTLAADQRDNTAQLNLALIYLNGKGVERDQALGEQWLRRSAANGNKRAEGLLKVGAFRSQ